MPKVSLAPIVTWLADLATITRTTSDPKQLTNSMRLLAPMLGEEYGLGPFIGANAPRSLQAVAKACPFFPSFAEVRSALGPWWRENRPSFPALAPPEEEPLHLIADWTDEQRAQAESTVAAALNHLKVIGDQKRAADAARITPGYARQSPILSDETLLALYERDHKAGWKGGEIRIAMLRKRIAERYA